MYEFPTEFESDRFVQCVSIILVVTFDMRTEYHHHADNGPDIGVSSNDVVVYSFRAKNRQARRLSSLLDQSVFDGTMGQR